MQINNARTITGNRIDDRLALGMARDIIRKLGSFSTEDNPDVKPLRTKSERARKSALMQIREDMGAKLIGIVAKKGYFEARLGTFSAISSNPSGIVDALAVITHDIDLRPPGRKGPFHAQAWPMTSPGEVAAMIEVHALARLIQRGGASTEDEVLDVVRSVASWSAHIVQRKEEGGWILPVRTGLIVARNQILPPERQIDCSDGPIAVIKTFLSHEQFRDRHRQAWDYLASAGILDAQPRYPTWHGLNMDQESMWSAMRSTCYAWDLRKYHSEQVRGDNLPVSEDLLQSLEDPEEGSDLTF